MSALQTTADATVLTQRVAQLLDCGRSGAARPLLAAAKRLSPGSIILVELAARLALQDGGAEEACEEVDATIAAEPRHAGLRKCRAELRRHLNDIEGAARDAAEAVLLDRTDPFAKALLGSFMLELGRVADAVSCLHEAVAAVPGHPAFREAYAAALEAAGDPDGALDTLLGAVSASPGKVEPRNAAILLCVRRRDFGRALEIAEAARRDGVADACVFGLKGHALSSLGRHEEAADSYAEALKLGPEDPYVRHLVAASGVMPGSTRAPAEYLRTVFDGYAERFERHLISLGYRMPGLFRTVLGTHPRLARGEHVGPVLDLGCGTGLIGLAISDLPLGPIVGVDLSPRMLAYADAKGLYAQLREADVMEVLSSGLPLPLWEGGGGRGRASDCPGSESGHPTPPPASLPQGEGEFRGERWPLILAADVLCYFGDLHPVMAAAHASLEPGGWFVCSSEELVPDLDGVTPGNGDWALQRQGRYAHNLDSFRRAAERAGFAVLRLDRETVRFEANAPVPGILAILERTRHDC